MRIVKHLLLCWIAACTVAIAQPAPPAAGPVAVDTPAECKAFGGAWVGHGTWQFACQAPWGRSDCLRLGGGWTPLFGAPDNGICIAAVSQSAVAKQCAQSGGNWGPAGSPMPLCRPGTGRPHVVVRNAADANKVCDSTSDCTYGCAYTGPPVADGTNVLGRCRANPRQSGCFSMVDKGRVTGSICVE
jgi:hypothetical protein